MADLERNPEVIYTELEEGAVLLHLTSGYYYSLDPVGMVIWGLIEPGTTPEGIGRALAESFEVDAERAAACARDFLDELRGHELVVPSNGATERPGNEQAGRGPETPARRPFTAPVLIRHDEPLSQLSVHPFDPQLPLAE